MSLFSDFPSRPSECDDHQYNVWGIEEVDFTVEQCEECGHVRFSESDGGESRFDGAKYRPDR